MSTQRIKAYQKLLRHLIGLCGAIFELVTGEEAPKWQDVLRS
jgi:hypothetical protein